MRYIIFILILIPTIAMAKSAPDNYNGSGMSKGAYLKVQSARGKAFGLSKPAPKKKSSKPKKKSENKKYKGPSKSLIRKTENNLESERWVGTVG